MMNLPTDVAQRIKQFNQGRRVDLLALKYAKLRKSGWGFFRGSGHLFYARAALPPALAAAPLAGLCGDLHLENFGAYRGENGLVCFSVNDFDDGLLAPVTWDLARFVASLFVGVDYLRRPAAEAEMLAEDFLRAYAEAVAAGGPALPDAAVLAGPVGPIARAFPDAAAAAALADSADLLPSGRAFNLTLKHKRFLPATDAERAEVAARVADFARQGAGDGGLRVLDVARQVAGTSSLGLDRYAVLLEGEGGGRLLELKEAQAACAAPYLTGRQTVWPSQAARVAAGQRVFQAVPPSRLGAVGGDGRSFVVRDFGRSSDRLSLDDPGLTERGLTATVRLLARVTAGGHWRGSAAEGGAGQAALQAFAGQPGWHAALIDFGRARAAQAQGDYSEYCAAFDRGELGLD